MENLVNLVPKGLELHFAAVIGQRDGLDDDANRGAIFTAGEIMRVASEKNFDVVACMAGAETGVQLCDRVSEKLGLRTNGGEGTEARRNKYLMCEKIRAYKGAGAPVRAVKQVIGFSYEADVKQVRSSASERKRASASERKKGLSELCPSAAEAGRMEPKRAKRRGLFGWCPSAPPHLPCRADFSLARSGSPTPGWTCGS
jgi:hypothetical protein